MLHILVFMFPFHQVDLYTSSVVVRSSIGVGRLVLTTRSVKILINERRHQLADLQKISRIEKYRLRERLSFLSVDALRFIKEGEQELFLNVTHSFEGL